MTVDRIVTMVVNAVIRRIVNIGVGQAFAALGRFRPTGRATEDSHDPETAADPRETTPARAPDALRRARQAARLQRRLRK